MKGKPDQKHDSIILMGDGRVQGLLPYADDVHGRNEVYPDEDDDFASLLKRLRHAKAKDEAGLGEVLPRLFSYHLAWCGDLAKAQWLTEKNNRSVPGKERPVPCREDIVCGLAAAPGA